MSTVLLAGGTGYIGSHTAVELIENGYDVVIADNFSNSSPEVLCRIEKITGKKPKFYELDVADANKLSAVFRDNDITTVIQLASLKAIGESVEKPLMYYRNNLAATLSLLENMQKFGTKNIIFSSSATVYGAENPVPYVETMKRGVCTNPYARTKLMTEQIIFDAAAADSEMSAVILRYFNPIGAHPSGLIGEDPKGIPNNLMPFISQVAVGKRDKLTVFGDDYPTPDGTCCRDYIHVTDLAKGHVKAVSYAAKHKGTEIFNLGSGRSYSVFELIKAFEQANDMKINYTIGARRAGDLPVCYANADKARDILGWQTEKDIYDMCRDSWNWQKNNPDGYR